MRRRLPAAPLASALALALCACMPMPRLRTGRALERDDFGRIEPGRTTRAEILARFGGPMAIVGRGETAAVPAASVWTADGVLTRGSFDLQGDAVFELFSRHPPGPTQRVYYWYRASSWRLDVFPVVGVFAHGGVDADELWVLVDESSGIVLDAAFRPSREPVQRPGGAAPPVSSR